MRLASRSRLAGVAMVLVLLSVSAFAVWSSYATNAAATDATEASRLSDDYADASTAVAAEESLERKFSLEPGPTVKLSFDQAAAAFVTAMAAVRRDGLLFDQALAERAVSQHQSFLNNTELLFRARTQADYPSMLQLDHDGDVIFKQIETAVHSGAETSHQDSLNHLAHLAHLERMNRMLTPLVFVFGLLLAGLLALVTRGHRRQLVRERARALSDSLHDRLSGLPNRTLLSDRLDQLLLADERAGTKTGLLLLDLDRFKEVNDTFGHQHGDELLKQVGPRLSAVLRDVDTVARLGGDEFAVLLPAASSAAAARGVAIKLREALEPSFCIFGVDLNIEASVGVAISGDHGYDGHMLLQRADIAMYAAKTRHLGVHSYSPDINQHSPARLALLGELRKALDSRDLVVHYQPKIDISTGQPSGVEALVRWSHPTHGLIYPDDFVPLAERTELIGPLTRYVLDEALTQIRAWSDNARPITVSVNLSARNLLDDHLPDMVHDLLAGHGVAPELLILEVTESALMSDPQRAKQILERLAATGVRISIDDFGAGYTSLGQLKTLPIAELKIDKSFVMTMTEDITNAVIVQSVIDLGHNLGLTIVAEGVETEAALLALGLGGCDIAQGYHFARPMPAASFSTWLADYEPTCGPTIPAAPGGLALNRA